MKYEEMPFETTSMMPDLSDEGVGTFGSGIVSEAEPVEKVKGTQEELGNELNNEQKRKIGGFLLNKMNRLEQLSGVKL